MLNELHICICQRKVLVILQVSRVLDHLVWTTSTNCHGHETKPTHTHTHTGPHNHRQTEIEIELQPELPQQLDFGLCEGFSLAFA